MDLTLKTYIDDSSLVAQDVTKTYIEKAKKLNADYFSFVRFHEDYINTHLDEFASRKLKAAPI
jgi:hypothetical protein